MRAVLDPNVIISALLSATGSPARLIQAWVDGRYELVVSRLLLRELTRALGYPKLRRRVSAIEAAQMVEWLERSGLIAQDPHAPPPVLSSDPADNYLLSLAWFERTVLVSGDRHLLALETSQTIMSPGLFLDLIDRVV